MEDVLPYILAKLDTSSKVSARLVCCKWNSLLPGSTSGDILFTQMALQEGHLNLFWLGIEWGLPLLREYYAPAVQHGLAEVIDFLIKEQVYSIFSCSCCLYDREDFYVKYCLYSPMTDDCYYIRDWTRKYMPKPKLSIETMYDVGIQTNNLALFKEALELGPPPRWLRKAISEKYADLVFATYPQYFTSKDALIYDLIDVYKACTKSKDDVALAFACQSHKILQYITGTTNIKEMPPFKFCTLTSSRVLSWIDLDLAKWLFDNDYFSFNEDMYLNLSKITTIEHMQFFLDNVPIRKSCLQSLQSPDVIKWLLKQGYTKKDLFECIIIHTPELLDEVPLAEFWDVLVAGSQDAWERCTNLPEKFDWDMYDHLHLKAVWWLVKKGVMDANDIKQAMDRSKYHSSVEKWLTR